MAALPAPTNLVRRAAHLRGAHQLVTHRRVEPLVSTAIRARLVHDSALFFAREAARRRVTATYRLREAPSVSVVLRHGTPDVEAFDEVFVQRIYTAPREVEDALSALSRAPRVADLGANVGLFGAWARARWPGASIVAFEPDPFNAAVLERTIAANGGEWTLLAACAGEAAGEVAFAAGRFATSRAVSGELAFEAPERGVIEVPVLDCYPYLETADLVKIDIEGGEWPILADPRLRDLPARALALEYHPEGSPRPTDARRAATALLQDAGFVVRDVPTAAPPGYGSLWAWRPSS